MAIVPSGSPPWARSNTHLHYGGHTNKANYLSRGAIDGLTDVSAEALCRIAADLEALHRVMPFAVITFQCVDTTPGPPIINSCYLMTGVRTTDYTGDAPPAGFPSAVRNGDGDVTFTFAATYSDSYGIVAAWAPKHAEVSIGYRTIYPGSVRAYGLGTDMGQVTLTVW